MSGWIKIYRDIQGHWIWKNPAYLKAWINILLTVNFEDKKVLIESELIDCKRGQALLSLQSWVKILGPGWTLQRVRTFFNLLKDDGMIDTEGMRKTTRLTVCKYEQYQDLQQANNKQTTDKQQAGNKQVTSTKEGKEGKEQKKERSKPSKSADFIDQIIDQFVQAHGSYEVVSKGKERAAAGRLLNIYKERNPAATSEEAIAALRHYFNQCVNINDAWLKSHMSLPIIIDKFNQINTILKNGGIKKSTGVTDAELAELYARKYGIDSPDREY